MIELQPEGNAKYEAEAFGRTAWRLTSSLREFKNIVPLDFWFEYPIHKLAQSDELDKASAKGSAEAKRAAAGKNLNREQRADSIRAAYDICAFDPDTPVTIHAMAEYLGLSDRAVRDRVKEMPGEFCNERSIVTRIY